jgi:hypothetical protein
MRRFKSTQQALRFLSAHGPIQNLFRVGRHHLKAVPIDSSEGVLFRLARDDLRAVKSRRSACALERLWLCFHQLDSATLIRWNEKNMEFFGQTTEFTPEVRKNLYLQKRFCLRISKKLRPGAGCSPHG